MDPEQIEALDRRTAGYSYAVHITDASSYQLAVEKRAGARALKAEVAEVMDPLIKSASDHLNKLRDTRKKMEWPLDIAIQMIDVQLLTYERNEETRRLKEEALIAEQLRLDTEKQRQAEVKTLERTGYMKESKRLAEAPLPEIPVPAVPTSVPKVSGMSTRVDWSAEVTNLSELIKAVANGKASQECLLPNMPVLNSMARSAKATLAVPGVKSVSKPVRVQRR